MSEVNEEVVEVKDRRRFEESGEKKKSEFELEPLQKWVVIRKITRGEEVSEAGVIKPGGGKSSRGIVVAAGPEVPLEKGDVVIFTNFATDIEDVEELTGDRDLKLVRWEEVYCRVRRCL